MTTTPNDDRPKLLVFPPLLLLSALVLGLAMQWMLPLGGLVRFDQSWRAAIGGALLLIGMLMMLIGQIALLRAGTAVNPRRPTTALVLGGPFRFSRNPIYVGGGFALTGIAVGFGLDWVIVFLVANMPLLQHGVVLREEAYLQGKFGEAYGAYRGTVSRYLWPFP